MSSMTLPLAIYFLPSPPSYIQVAWPKSNLFVFLNADVDTAPTRALQALWLVAGDTHTFCRFWHAMGLTYTLKELLFSLNGQTFHDHPFHHLYEDDIKI